MQRLLVYCCFCFLYFNAASQTTVNVDNLPSNAGGVVNYKYAGTPYVNAKFVKITEGTPFFNDQMMKGTIILSDGKEYKDMMVRLNLLESQLNYLNDQKNEMIATTPIREVIIKDTINNKDHRFIFSNDIQATEKPEKDFYELLQTGKAELYKQHKKRILERKPYGAATIEQSIKTDIKYYLLLKGTWTHIKKVKQLPDLFPGKRSEIQKFINEKKLTADNQVNFESIVAHYNMLVGQ